MVNFLTSCQNNRFDIDTSHVNVEPVVFKRLDKDLFSLNAQTILPQTRLLQQKYSSFYGRYITSIINHGGTRDSLYTLSLLRFIQDRDMGKAYKDLTSMYSDNDIELLGEAMTEVVKRFKVFFPKRPLPKQFVTFMSGFNYNVVYVDSTLGIGLDMYLGSSNPFYSALQLPKFRTRTMNKEHLLSDAVRAWVLTEFDNQEAVNNLLHHMVFYGKLFYAVDALLPDVHDSVKFGYTSAQIRTCELNEKNYWGFFVKDNKLYENDLKTVSEFTSDGPFTRAISRECPPRIAMWLGRQIVKSYMDHHQGVSLENLMNETDAQSILTTSKYKP